MASRSTWSGAVEFGGFPIHLKAYTLVRSRSADSLRNLCPCHQQPVVMPKVCATTGDTLDATALLKGVAIGRNDVRVLTPEHVEALAKADRTDVLAILGLPPRDSVPLHMAVGHYRLVPDDKIPGSAGPADILWNGLHASARCLTAEWVKRAGSRNELVAITADEYGLTAVALPYLTDLNEVPEHAYTENEQAAKMFETFAQAQGIVMDDFAHTAYVDGYDSRRKEVVASVLAGTAPNVTPSAPAKPNVPDLMAAMAAAMEQTKPSPAKRTRKAKA